MTIFFHRVALFRKANMVFGKNRSTINAIIEVTEYLPEQLDKNCKVLDKLCLLDLKKEFDTIDHKILLCKLEKYGFSGKIYSLTEDYLTTCTQYAIFNRKCSSMKQITTGVPQGSVLGPF